MKRVVWFALALGIVACLNFAQAAETAETVETVETVQALLDPVMLESPLIDGSMIGGCLQGTDQDPIEAIHQGVSPESLDLCLVYFVADMSKVDIVKAEYQKLANVLKASGKITGKIAVRFTKSLGPMEAPGLLD